MLRGREGERVSRRLPLNAGELTARIHDNVKQNCSHKISAGKLQGN